MKRLLLAVGLAVGDSARADMPGDPCRRRAPAYVPFFTWNGFYVGINAGYGFGHRVDRHRHLRPALQRQRRLVGGTPATTCSSARVFGVEAISTGATSRARHDHCSAPAKPRTLARHGARADRLRLRPLPALRHRGRRFGDIKGTLLGVGDFSQTKVGWTAGAGVEYAFIDNWSAKLEYLYVDLGKATCDAACSGGDPIDAQRSASNIVRGGVNYKF